MQMKRIRFENNELASYSFLMNLFSAMGKSASTVLDQCEIAEKLLSCVAWRANQWPSRCPRWVRRSVMFSIRWQECIPRSRQQITAMLLVVASLFALLPIPFSAPPPGNGKDHSRPFPCQDRPCGCRSAEQCKKKCCCFSAEQKLAWAKQNGVDASDVVASAVKCEATFAANSKKCCSSNRVAKVKPVNRMSKAAKKASPRSTIVIGVVARECQGVAQTLSGQSVFVIPPILSVHPLVEPTGERLILEGLVYVQRIAEPPVPPPRLSAA